MTWQGNRPSRAQRVTVFGDTPSILETSDRVRKCVPTGSAVVASLFFTVELYFSFLGVQMNRMAQQVVCEYYSRKT